MVSSQELGISFVLNYLGSWIPNGLNSNPPPINVHSKPLQLCMESFFVDIIKVRIKMRPCWVRVGPKSSECHFKRQKRTQRHREEGFLKTEV